MKITTIRIYFILVSLALLPIIVQSCDKDDNVSSQPPQFERITQIDNLEKNISTGDMGDWISIQGSNLESTKEIIFNDVSINMLDVYYENDILYLQIPVLMPTDINNKIKVVTQSGEFEFDFIINIPDIKLTNMFNEYTLPGDTMKIYGDFFELYKVNSTNTVIKFKDIEKPVINVGKNYITVQVPNLVEPNIKLTLYNKEFDASATCPGYYQDRQNMITNFDDIAYTGGDGAQFVGLWDNPKPISGKYSLLTVGSQGSGWAYMLGTGYNYTVDMKDNPNKYEIKFELNMINPIMNTKFFVYNYWNYTPAEITAADLVVQNPGVWETIAIPLSRLIPIDFKGDKGAIGSFNIRIDSPTGEPIKMGWDNFRISLKD